MLSSAVRFIDFCSLENATMSKGDHSYFIGGVLLCIVTKSLKAGGS